MTTLAGRTALAIVDQGMWSITNFLLFFGLARAVSPADFGTLAIGSSVLVLAAGVTIACSGEVVALASKGGAGTRSASHALGLSLVIALTVSVAGVVIALAALAPSGTRDDLALLLGAGFFSITAEGLRSIAYGRRRIAVALWLSVAWLSVQASALGMLYALWSWTGTGVILCWGAGGVAASSIGLVALRIRPSVKEVSTDDWRRRRHFVVEFIATAGPTHLMVFLSGGLLSLTAAGSLRALQTVFGPINVIMTGLRNAIVPFLVSARTDPRSSAIWSAAVAGGLAALATTVLAFLPAVGRAAMGDSWPETMWLVAAFGASRVAVGIVLGALMILRVGDETGTSLRLRLLTAVCLMLGFLLGVPSGLTAAMWGSALAGAVMAVVWWRLALRRSRNGTSPF